MLKSTIPVLAFVALCACATAPATTPFEPLWLQREDEAGKLPVGRVLAVVEVSSQRLPSLSEPAPAGVASGASLKPSTGGLTAFAASQDVRIYRHTVELRTGATGVFETEYAFQVGNCVAVRPRSSVSYAVLVSALPGQCD